MSKKVFMFSGQGSQYHHMGSDLFEKHDVFRKWMVRLDEIIGDILGESVLDHIYSGSKKRSDPFNRTLYTHPAIFMIEYSLMQVLASEGVHPDVVIGTSMGEFASAVCAGILEVEGAAEILLQQARALEDCPSGGMLAILAGADLFESEPALHENSELASVNFDSHFVVSGLDDGLRRIIELLKAKNINYQLLPVSQAFHSSYIEDAAYTFVQYLAQRDYGTPQVRYISGTYGKELSNVSDTYFWEIVRKPMEFRNAVHGLEENDNYVYIDLGPSGTLANFVKYNLVSDSMSKTCHLITPFGHAEKNIRSLHECLV